MDERVAVGLSCGSKSKIAMHQCQFVYKYGEGSNRSGRGGRCEREGTYRQGTLCKLHRNRKVRFGNIIETSCDKTSVESSFPRIFTDEEERNWVDEARRRTSPEANVNGCCVVCGRLKELNDLSIVTEQGHDRLDRVRT
jgi:hypothetical protein